VRLSLDQVRDLVRERREEEVCVLVRVMVGGEGGGGMAVELRWEREGSGVAEPLWAGVFVAVPTRELDSDWEEEPEKELSLRIALRRRSLRGMLMDACVAN